MAIAPQFDDTDPAIPALRLEPFASAPQALIVLTRDAQLLATLRNVATGHAVEAVEAETDLASQLMHAQGGVALIDAAAVTSAVTSLTERLKAQFPDLVLVVAGDSEDQGALTQQITRGLVYRFLHKPLSEQRVRLFVAAAWRRHGEEHAGTVGAARTQPARTLPPVKGRRPWWIAIVAALAGLGVVAWLKYPQPAPTVAPPASLPAATPQVASARGPQASSAGTITRAAAPVSEAEPSPAPPVQAPAPAAAPSSPTASRIQPPKSEVAGTTGSAVSTGSDSVPLPSGAAASPQTLPAEPEPNALAVRIAGEARNALAEGKIEEADRLIGLAAAAGVDEDTLDDLMRKITELRIAGRGTQMTRLAQLFNERLTQGRVLEPAQDSAQHYLTQLKSTDAGHPSTRSAQDAFAGRLVQEARRSVADEDLAAARRWLAEARQAAADDSVTAGIEASIVASQEATAKASPTVASSALHKIRHVDPQYPQAARAREVNGWVDLELSVQTDGSVGAVTVVAAEPRDIFDKAAIDAVRQWRYEPVQRDGEAAEQRTRVRIRFKLQ